MKSNIQKIILVLTIIIFNIESTKAQNIDSLLSKISNKDVYIVLVKHLSPRISGSEAKKIVVIGKPITAKLINVLEDQKKGIAAHFILSAIWKETWEEEICCNIKYFGNLEILNVNGLEICFNDTLMFASAENLHKNKILWQSRIKV